MYEMSGNRLEMAILYAEAVSTSISESCARWFTAVGSGSASSLPTACTVNCNMARSEQKKRRARSTVGGVVQKEKRRKRFDDGYDKLPEDELGDVFTA